MPGEQTTRAAAKRISICNHKGGVGKTTLTFNIATQLAIMGKRVLLVDADPQCNLTAYVIDSEVLDDLLDHSDDDGGETIWSAVKPICDASGGIKEIAAIELRNSLYLLPGDIRLSDFEEELTEFWRLCFQRKRRGFVGTTALSALVNQICEKEDIDFVFYDSGPNIGPLNRVILLDCDYFIVPAAYDLFSVRALKTLGRTLFSWICDWQTISELAPEDVYLLPGKPNFLGYIPQNLFFPKQPSPPKSRIRVITSGATVEGPSSVHFEPMSGFAGKADRSASDIMAANAVRPSHLTRFCGRGTVYRGGVASEQAKYLGLLDKSIQTEIVGVLGGLGIVKQRPDYRLGEIKDFGTLVTASQKEGRPIFSVRAGTTQQREKARREFRNIAQRIIKQAS